MKRTGKNSWEGYQIPCSVTIINGGMIPSLVRQRLPYHTDGFHKPATTKNSPDFSSTGVIFFFSGFSFAIFFEFYSTQQVTCP